MRKGYNSTASYIGNLIDCRCLSLMTEFYDLSFDDSLRFACDVVEWASEILQKDFIVKRKIMNKRSSTPEKALLQLKNEFSSKRIVLYGEEGMAISPVVYNDKTYREHMHSVHWGKNSSLPGSQYVSTDFLDFWNCGLDVNEISTDQIKQRILHVFREEGKRHMSFFQLPDVQSFLKILPYTKSSNRFHGAYTISFSAFCLDVETEKTAEYLANWAEYLSRTYQKVNARVMLQPMVGLERSPYMMIFGQKGNVDGSHTDAKCTPQEWYPTYYIPGAEWFNILSPLASSHLSINECQLSEDISTRETLEGTTTIRSTKPIIQYDITESLEMKRLLYPALYPGSSCVKLKPILSSHSSITSAVSFPRSNWAIIPVFEDEIEVIGDYLAFSSN